MLSTKISHHFLDMTISQWYFWKKALFIYAKIVSAIGNRNTLLSLKLIVHFERLSNFSFSLLLNTWLQQNSRWKFIPLLFLKSYINNYNCFLEFRISFIVSWRFNHRVVHARLLTQKKYKWGERDKQKNKFQHTS